MIEKYLSAKQLEIGQKEKFLMQYLYIETNLDGFST